MAISFPGSPSTGQVFTSGNRSWTWDGSAWKGGVSSTGDATTLDGFDSTDFMRTNHTGSFAANGRLSLGLTDTESSSYYANKLVLEVSSQDGITIAANNTTATNYLMFADGTSGNASYRGYIEYNHSTENLALAQAAIHRLNFDNTGAVFNEAGNDYDFRVESDTVTHALFVRGNDGNVGIGTTPYANARLTIGGADGGGYPAVLQFDNNNTSGAEFFMLATDTYWTAGANKFVMGHGAPSSGNVDMTIDGAGNVGIGTYNPGFKMDVEGTTRITSMSTSPGGGAGLEIRYNTGGSWGGLLSYDRGGAGYQELRLEGSIIKLIESGEATPTLTVNNSNVGIGDDNPNEKFTIKGDGARMTISSNDYEVAMLGRRGSTAPNWDRGYLRMKYDGTNTIVLDTGGVSYLNGGNVGIGTNNPATPLHVRNVGNPNGGNRNTVETVLTLDSTGYFPYNGYGIGIDFKGEDYGNNTIREYAKIEAVMTDHSAQNASGDPSFRSALSFWTNTGGASNTTATEKMRIASSGNVGIGTVTPNSPLHVHADGIGIRLDGTANTTRKLFFRSTSTTNPAEIYADGTLRLWTEDAGTDIKLEPADDILMNPGGNVNIGGSAGSMTLNVNGSIYLGDNGTVATGIYSGRHNIVGADSNVYIVGDGNTSSPNAADKVVIGLGNTANTNYDSLRGASLASLETPAVVTAEFYTTHAKILKQLQLLNSSSNPSSPKTGAIYYNTTDDVVKVYSGTEWVDVGSPPMNASGGTVATYTVGGQSYRSHTFTSSGTFTPTVTGTVDVLVVAGGGCGGRDNAGGGGAGGLRTSTNVVVTPSSYTIVVGAGGASNTNDNGGNSGTGFNGANSSAIGITSLGGGFGGSAGTNNPSGQNRTSGGSGGGGAGAESTRSGGSGTAGQGNAGGPGHPTNGGGGGGGGAGAVGDSYSGTNDGGHGGIGVQNDYRTGSNVYYAGGGGAGNNNSVYTLQPGGSGGGGTGGNGGSPGSANTGGGGGGHTHPATNASTAGGSGIVVIRYPI